ncbi:MFS domain-containing histidine kinase [Luteithermobacter gelatinilyticus]|uniref:MFS domain-containing histidine kinase n=1 Tax=Luteithermobacter gelatinilyticus TaxID=2582913 RepID=UPI0011074190|nr:MFS domain-containing histidine kinase [Luteithermobacter gelatinilyticus]
MLKAAAEPEKDKDINRLGEFLSPVLEKEFLDYQWPRLVKNFKYFTYTLTGIFVLAILFSLLKKDAYNFQTYFNIGARTLSFIPLFIVMALFMNRRKPERFLLLSFLCILNATGIFLLSIGLFVSDNWVNFAAAFVLITIGYTVYPMTNLHKIIFGTATAIGLQIVNLTRFSPDVEHFFLQSAMLFSANIFGYWQMHNTSVLTRGSFLSLHREKALNKKLAEELSQRKKAEETSRQNEELFRSLFRASMYPLGLIKAGTTDLITANKAFYELFNIPENNQQNPDFLSRIKEADRFLDCLLKTNREEGYVRDTLRIAASENNIRIAETCMISVHINNMRFILVGLSDVTQQKKEEQQLRDLTEEAISANKAKTEFLANMSHELRTPLNAILGFTEIMQQELLGPIGNDQYKAYLKDIHHSGQNLMSMIAEILDISQLEAGNFPLVKDNVRLEELIHSSISLVKENYQDHNIILETQIHDPDLSIHVDVPRLKQVIYNLLSNAYKFSLADDTVRLTTFETDQELCIRIRDEGIGIAPEAMEKIFEPFTQEESSYHRKHHGAGLGLVLSKKLTEAHDGTLELESQLHEGTSVTIKLPRSCIIRDKVAQPLRQKTL